MDGSADDELLVGRYRRRRALGSGGMGDVWLADDLELGRPVAVKRLRVGVPEGLDAELVERMLREARVVARLHHPAIVTLHDLVRVAGRPHLIMQYVDGESLGDRIGRERTVPWPVAARVVADIADALDVAHRAGVLHRDVKPANVLLDADGRGHLADFGIARGTEDAAITRAGEIVGTVAYLPPEAARDQPIGAPGDVWSLGATFFAAVEGSAPFAGAGASVPAILARLARDDAPAPTRAGAAHDLLVRMLATDPSQRPSAAQVAGELTALLAAPPAPPTPSTVATDVPPDAAPTEAAYRSAPRPAPGPAPGPAPSSRRRRTPWAWAAVVVLVACGVGAALALGGGGSGAPEGPGGSGRSTGPGEAADVALEPDVAVVEVGIGAGRAVLSPDGTTSFVPNLADGTVSVIDNSAGEVRATIAACEAPSSVAVAPDGARVYAACDEGVVAVVDVAREQATQLPVPGTPGPVRVSEDGSTLFVPTDDGTIAVVDTATSRVRRIGAGARPGLVQITPDGATAYAPDPQSDAIVVLDTDTLRAELVPVPHAPDGLQLNTAGTRLYATAAQGRVLVLDVGSERLVRQVKPGGRTTARIRIAPDDTQAWLPYPETGVVKVLDLGGDSMALLEDVDIGGTPGRLVLFSPDSTTAYVADLAAGDVAAIDTATFEVSRLEAGESPTEITLSEDGSTLVAVSGGSEAGQAPATATIVPLG